MKKVILSVFGLAVLSLSSASMAGMKYECWTYVGGSPDKMTYITADSRSDAEYLVQSKFRDLGAKWDYIKCK
jgi:hypothetical protein